MVYWWRNIGLAIAALSLLLVTSGVSYQEIKSRTDASRFPRVGKSVDIGGYKLNLDCTGQGGPTVVLDTGFGLLASSWQGVQPEVAKFTRVCSYDRAGYGWSDSSPMPRTSLQIATELHTLLQAAGEKPPYVLVGHSFGGLNVRVFNGLYPNEVDGLILVESSHPDLLKRLPPGIKTESDEAQRARERQREFASVRFRLGIARFEARKVIDDPNVPYGAQEATYLSLQPKYLDAIAREGEALEQSSEQAAASGTLGDKPLTVLTAGKGVLGMPIQGKDLQDMQNTWINDLQLQLAHLSSRGKRIMVPDSDHMIPFERPDAIVNAVREICAEVNEH